MVFFAKDKNIVMYVKNKEYDQLNWLKFQIVVLCL